MKQFNIPNQYKSSFIQDIKRARKAEDKLKRDFSPTFIKREHVTFILARHFGFCYGVENAVEKIYHTLEEFPNKRVFLLSQMIHNPIVNEDLLSRGVNFIMDTQGNQLIDWDSINKNDIVVTPAFGTTLEIEQLLINKNIDIKTFDTTCPFVEKVWKRSAKLGNSNHTIIIHGKANHEETRATFSHSKHTGKAIVIKDIEEAKILGELILNNGKQEDLNSIFKDNMSEHLKIDKDFNKLGVVNQTTMLASETHEIAEYFKTIMIKKYGEESIKNHFADTRDTLCYATNDNQNATLALMKEKADFAVVVGGYNSSNTTHLVELLEQKFETFFISSEKKISSANEILSFNYKTKQEEPKFFPIPKSSNEPLNIIVTCGASCPDRIMEDVIQKLDYLFNVKD